MSADWPIVSQHAARRFHERKRDCQPPVGPRAAWIEGRPVPRPHGLDADAVRYHDGVGLALVCEGHVLVTAIRAGQAASPTLRQAVARVGGGSA
jgi:hypothetical protein